MAPSPSLNRAVTKWTARVIPLLLLGAIGYSSWVVIKVICINYYINTPNHESGVGIAFLVPYCILLFLVAITYVRLILVIFFDPGLVPLGPGADNQKQKEKTSKQRPRQGGHDLEAQRYEPGPDNNPDSPGLEQFYNKDIFVCEDDGRPRWCSHCLTWKPDRAHHSSELNRCVRKMDHFCPWVGGIISETSFKFFVQFVFYAALYCAVALTASAYTLAVMLRDPEGPSFDANLVGVIALAGFFGLFTFTMTLATSRYIFINQTNVDVLKAKMTVYQLAIRVPRGTPPSANYGLVTYPLPRDDRDSDANGKPVGPASKSSNRDAGSSSGERSTSKRDQLATRTFAIVKTDMGENPWDLGLYRNWVSIMGPHIWDWVLPLHQSPCVGYESTVSMYPVGRLYPALRARFGLPALDESRAGPEMRQRRR